LSGEGQPTLEEFTASEMLKLQNQSAGERLFLEVLER
jgi:hypothetical protein